MGFSSRCDEFSYDLLAEHLQAGFVARGFATTITSSDSTWFKISAPDD
jgi:hypothetical protein